LIRYIGLVFVITLVAGCAPATKAPVIDRTPAASQPASKDWRPDLYTVKRGDTLYSIGLEHGYDYKEIARANNIPPPYVIYVGQQLKLKPDTPAPSPEQPHTTVTETEEVVITPLDMGSIESNVIQESGQATATTMEPAPQQTTVTTDTQLISGPIAMREPYSDQALNTPPLSSKPAPEIVTPPLTTATDQPSPPVVPPTPDVPPAVTEESAPTTFKAPTATATNAGITWSWPTRGELLSGFNEGGNAKGIDIAGSNGQPILAAAPGKVIYSGSDLRGYGRLVIIKHNDEFLSVYAHNSKILVKEGESVTRGQKIAEMGNSDADRVKLHFEIRRQGKSVDPSQFLPRDPG